MSKVNSDIPALQGLNHEECTKVAGGYLADFQDISEFPRWALPFINVAKQNVKLFETPIASH